MLNNVAYLCQKDLERPRPKGNGSLYNVELNLGISILQVSLSESKVLLAADLRKRFIEM